MIGCKYQVITEDLRNFVPKCCCICTRYPTEPPFPECNEDSCKYFQEKLDDEFRKNPHPSPGWRYCPYMPPDSSFQCSRYLNNCSTCGFNPAVKEQREKELAERKRLEEESKLSYKIKRFFKTKG